MLAAVGSLDSPCGSPWCPMPITVRVSSWNLHGPPLAPRRDARFDEVARRILREDPDVVHFQEVWIPDDATRLIDMLCPSYEPVPDAGRGLILRTGGLLSFLKRRHVALNGEAPFQPFDRYASKWRFWQGDGISGKGVQSMVVGHTGVQLVFLNAHLQSPYRGQSYADTRLAQLRQLQRIASSLHPELPLIAVGDLNTAPEENLDPQFDAFWIDITQEHRRRCAGGTHYGHDGREADWIDYVLVRRQREWSVDFAELHRLENAAVDYPYSDHHGLLATVGLHHLESRPQGSGVTPGPA